MLQNLSDKISKTIKQIRGQARLTESNINQALREVRIALLEADVALEVTKDFIEKVKNKAIGKEVIGSLTPAQAFIDVVHQDLITLMGSKNEELNLNTQPPAIILMAGLQGSGKTTSTAKLALMLKAKGKKVITVSTDVYRPAAIDQLKKVSKQVEVDFFESSVEERPLEIATKALQRAKQGFYDVLIIDTAGRLAIDKPMMQEIKEIQQEIKPIETLFVLDSMQGQDAVNVAKIFNEELPITGIVITKLDGDSRGGAALSAKAITGKPIKFIGTGEKIQALEPFYPDRIANRILGMGDMISLIEDVKRQVDKKETDKLISKIKSGKQFSLDDFKTQIEQMDKLGDFSQIVKKLPFNLSSTLSTVDQDSVKLAMRRSVGIIDSMTPKERAKPEIIKASRKKRIAQGAGLSIVEVNRLLNQYEEMKKAFKQINAKGGMSKMFASLMRGRMF